MSSVGFFSRCVYCPTTPTRECIASVNAVDKQFTVLSIPEICSIQGLIQFTWISSPVIRPRACLSLDEQCQ
jgi:hypothetical protein